MTTEPILLFSLIFVVAGSRSPSETTVCVVAYKVDNGTYNFYLEHDISYKRQRDYEFLIPAASWFNQSLESMGMAFQTVKTSGQFEDKIQAYWAGFLEFYISREMSNAHLENTFGGFCKNNSSAECHILRNHVRRNLEMTIKKSLQSGDIDPYWHQMELILWQMRGIQDAWNNVTVNNSNTLTNDYLMQLLDDVFDIYLLQLNVDIGDISRALGIYDELDRGTNGKRYFANRPGCSGFVKLKPDHQDIFIAHATWQGYESMLKVIKYYEFAWRLTRNPSSAVIPASGILFSSYPSTINSIDDFYVASTGLVLQETTISIRNPELWSLVRQGLGNNLLEVFRVMIATRLARTPSEWISFFSRDNSGTYNNQWMVIDTKLMDPPNSLPKKDLFWVAEQIPGFVQSADVTEHLLNTSYWGSYNNPYFKFIHGITGFDDLERQFGEYFSYDKNPRAKIFRRDQSKATSMGGVYRLMRYNNFSHDPLSRCNCTPPYSAQNAISARGDLNDPHGAYPHPELGFRLHGATDVKLVNLEMARSLSMVAAAGPTYDDVPVFEWSRVCPASRRPLMHPNYWAFSPVVVWVDKRLMHKQAFP